MCTRLTCCHIGCQNSQKPSQPCVLSSQFLKLRVNEKSPISTSNCYCEIWIMCNSIFLYDFFWWILSASQNFSAFYYYEEVCKSLQQIGYSNTNQILNSSKWWQCPSMFSLSRHAGVSVYPHPKRGSCSSSINSPYFYVTIGSSCTS